MRRRLGTLALVLVTAAGIAGPGSAITTSRGLPPPGRKAMDVRASAPGIPPTARQVEAMVALVREYPDAKLTWNARFGTPSEIIRYGATLTPGAAGSPSEVARGWLRDHAALFGWSDAQVAALKLEKVLTQPNGGPQVALFHQVFGGLEGGSLGGSLTVGFDAANRILSVRANVVRTVSLERGPRLSAADALGVASGRAAPKMVGHRAGWLEFAHGEFPMDHYVRAVAFPRGSAPALPAWEVLFVEKMDSVYRTVVDALSGEVLYRFKVTVNDAPEGRVFKTYPGAPLGGKHELVSFAGDPVASPAGWLNPVSPAALLPTTIGNNAITATHWVLGLAAPDGPGELRPIAPTGTFDEPYKDAWHKADCKQPSFALDAMPAVVSLFYHHNIAHDFWYHLGFDEPAGALQANNFGKGGLQGDPLLGLAQASPLVASNNAYMQPLPDGVPEWSGMFLFTHDFQGNPPCVDGDFDATVVYHEYAHAVTNRWVGAEYGNLETAQGGSMGEAWSDFFAMNYLHSNGLETTDAVGVWVTGDYQRGIRNWPLSEVAATFGDIGYDGGPEVHSDGEIWSGTLWDIRTTLANARHDQNLAAQLVADAMPLSGPSPSMLDMRDAILAADMARTKGANQSLLWTAFARHGMGFSAQSKDGNDTDPTGAFDHKDAAHNGTLAVRVVDGVSRLPIPRASVFLGELELGVNPITHTADDGTLRLRLAEGKQRITIAIRGYGSRVVRLTIPSGRVMTGEIPLQPNYASTALGARIVAFSSQTSAQTADLAIDDEESTTWSSESNDSGPAGQFITVRLGGGRPVTFQEVRLATLGASSRLNALKKWTLLVSDDGKTFREVTRGAFTTGKWGPGVADQTYRTWRLAKPVTASFVKLVADGAHDTAAKTVEVAELQVFGRGLAFSSKPVKGDALHLEANLLVPYPYAVDAQTPPTALLLERTCQYPPLTQGLDGYVFELPGSFADGHHRFVGGTEPGGIDPLADADVFFYTADCKPNGSEATATNPESGSIPAGTKYVVVELWSTLPAKAFLDVTSASSLAVQPLKRIPIVKGEKTIRPLPGTGVPSGATAATLAFALALALAGWLRRADRRASTKRS